jgi:hypothetical protein
MAENVTCTQKEAGSNHTMDEISNKILYRIFNMVENMLSQ